MSEQLKVTIAVGVSLLLHLLIGIVLLVTALAVPAKKVASALPELRMVEVTIQRPPPSPALLAAATPPPKVIRSTLDGDGLQKADKPPENPLFESDKDSIAASERPPTGTAPLPSQEGKERPHVDFTTRDYSLGKGRDAGVEVGAQAPPSAPAVTPAPAKPEPTVTPTPGPLFTPTPLPKPAANAFALGKPTPVPLVTPAATPQQVAKLQPKPARPAQWPRNEPGYQSQKEKTKIEGSISNRGKAGVDAIGTPIGRYRKTVADAIGSRWYYYIDRWRDLTSAGEVIVKFAVTAEGKIEDVKIVSNTANSAFGELCVRSVTEAKFPPLSPDVLATLDKERLEIDFTFNLYDQ